VAKRARALCGAAIGLAAWCLPARADPSEVAWPTFYRAGPGRNYVVLDELDRGVRLDVTRCAAGWCQARWEDTVGYVEQDALLAPAAVPAKPPAPQGCVESRVTGSGYHNGLDYAFCPR
jgi:uncharacterized protein YraI